MNNISTRVARTTASRLGAAVDMASERMVVEDVEAILLEGLNHE